MRQAKDGVAYTIDMQLGSETFAFFNTSTLPHLQSPPGLKPEADPACMTIPAQSLPGGPGSPGYMPSTLSTSLSKDNSEQQIK